MRSRLWLVLALFALLPTYASAQQIPAQLGLPTRWQAWLGPSYQSGAAPHAALGGSIYRDILNPAMGALGWQLDGSLGSNARSGSVALGIRSPVLRLGAGINADFPGTRLAPYATFSHPIVRGGLIRGGLLYGAWVFGGAHRLRAGLTLPITQRWIGRDRPRADRVQLHATSSLQSPVSTTAIPDLRAWILRVNGVVVPPLDSTRWLATQLAPRTAWRATDIIRAYHKALDEAFADPAVADTVRAVLLHELLIPYDRLLGQKREPETLAPFRAAVLNRLSRYDPRVRATSAAIISALEEVVRLQRTQWGDERLVWLPLQLALKPEQHQTQAQVDTLLAQLAQGEFADSNQISYLRNEQFQWELFRSIHDARSYHVLWVHDFRGVGETRQPDTTAFKQVAYGYLSALIDRVRAYDTDGALPEYHIFLDQYYYELNRSRVWLQLLRDPLHARFSFRGAPPAWHALVDSLQAELRNAVAHSTRLQQDASEKGEAWVRDRVSVHVHVTQQADPTFWSSDLLPVIGMSDNALRDHRKLVFYDVTEGDPYRGAVIVTGMGVGDLYSSSGWEDRAAILRGPAALVIRQEAIKLLRTNGIAASRLPFFLRPRSDTVALGALAPTPEFDLGAIRAMQVHNEVGYGEKRITAARAALYSLLPDSAVVKVADPLWLNPLWGSLLLGHALRGGRVLVIAPALANAPSNGRGEMTLAEELLAQLLQAHSVLADAIAQAGGLLRVGIYDAHFPVDDIPARINTALANREKLPWLRELEPFSQEVIDSLKAVARDMQHDGAGNGTPTPKGDPPKLHMKAASVASADAYQNLFAQPGWGAALAAYFRATAELQRERPRYAEFYRLPANTQVGAGAALALREEVAAKQAARVLYYLVIGSFNGDYRSALLDGESVLFISGFGSAAGIADFVLLPSLCTWVETPEELHRYLPRTGGRARWLANALKILY